MNLQPAHIAALHGCLELVVSDSQLVIDGGVNVIAKQSFIGRDPYAAFFEIHENPRIAAGQTLELKPGMVVTIEPGIYLAGKFGIRIEDMVAVTPNGGKILTPAPKAMIQL